MKQSDNVIFVDFALTPEQRRFKKMLSMYPCLQPFWNFEQRTCDTAALLLNWDEFSGDEQEMARFFCINVAARQRSTVQRDAGDAKAGRQSLAGD